MIELTLYSTPACHLCDEAELLLQQLGEQQPFILNIVDISESESLVEEYGIRIPVLSQKDSVRNVAASESSEGADGKRELGWPFSYEQLSAWVAVGA